MIQRTNVQIFIYSLIPSFKLLILKRTPERSGYWQPVCGGVEDGETLVDAALREVWEETEIKNIKSIVDLEYTFTYKENKGGVLMDMQDSCFAMEVEYMPQISLSEEHETYKWCSYPEVKEYFKWEHNLIALEKLMHRISN